MLLSRAVKDGDTIYYKLEGGNHGNLLYGHIYTFANVVNNKTGTVIHLPKSWWEVIYIYTHGALTIQEGDEERTTSVTNQDRLALPQPTGNTPGSESEGGKATKIVFGMSPQTPTSSFFPRCRKISGLPTSKQHERIAIHIRQTYKRRMVSSPTMPDILHSVIAHFFRLTTMSVPSANPRLTSMRRPSGPVILLCYGQWPFSSAVWTPYPFCGQQEPDLGLIVQGKADGNRIKDFLALWAVCIDTFSQLELEEPSNNKDGMIVFACFMLACGNPTYEPEDMKLFLQFASRLVNGKLTTAEGNVCTRYQLYRSAWQNRSAGAGRSNDVQTRTTMTEAFKKVAEWILPSLKEEAV